MPRGRKKQEEPVIEQSDNDEPVVEEQTPKKRGRKPKTKPTEKKTKTNKVIDELINDDISDEQNNSELDIIEDNVEVLDADADITDDNLSDRGEDTNVKQDTQPRMKNTTHIERGSAHTYTQRNMNTRVKVVDTDVKGKTYNRKDFERRYTNRRTHNQSVLRFSYNDAISTGDTKTLSEASMDEILRYLIATTHTDKRALCNVFRNTLSGIHNETTLPQTTYKPRHTMKPRRKRE